MTLIFVALRSVAFASGFVWLWAWVALLLRRYDDVLGGPLPALSRPFGFVALSLGGALAAWCIGSFVVRGHGTPAVFDAPRRLVAVGPYPYVRNPMYIGGALLLLGYGLDQQSPSIILFVPAWWLLFHLVVVLYEEPTLRSKFGRDYDEYCRRVPRWIPRRIALGSLACLLLPFTALLIGAEQSPGRRFRWTVQWEHFR